MNTTAHKSTIDLIAARLAGRIALAELPDDDMRALASNDGLTIDGAVFWITDSWTVYGFRSILDDTREVQTVDDLGVPLVDYVDTECPIP